MPYEPELIEGIVGSRTVSVVAVVVVVVGVVLLVVVPLVVLVVACDARAMESAQADESRAIESTRMRSMRAIESARATESRRAVSRRATESARATESRMKAESRRVATSPVDSLVTRTRCCDVVRRVVSACAAADDTAPTVSATATAPANEYLTFIHPPCTFATDVRPRGRSAGGAPPAFHRQRRRPERPRLAAAP